MKIEIDLSKEELVALEKGVELWSQDPQRSGLMGAMFGAMLGPREGSPGYEKYKKSRDDLEAKEEQEVNKRKVLSLRLRAKLLEVSERIDEFAAS